DGLAGYEQTMKNFERLFAQGSGIKRELVSGSLEVYPIKDYGAVQLGLHTFCHPENGVMDCGTFKFIHIWRRTDDGWKISRVISYNH
ncbi:MAG: nuclear transport factor 2 family protein, partial [Burkholderiales bacterium]